MVAWLQQVISDSR